MFELLLALTAFTAAPDLPADPFQRSATRALAGGFGTLAAWQEEGYKRGLARGVTCRGYTYLTSYGLWESSAMGGGPNAAQSLPGGKDRKLDISMCAADRGLRYGTVVWAAGSLRVVRDRGGWVTVPRARNPKRGHPRNERNLDFFTKRRDEYQSRSTPYAVMGTMETVYGRASAR